MDAAGAVLAQPRGRDVAAFDAAFTALGRLADLERRAAAGETGLDAEILLAEHTLGRVSSEDFERRAAELTEPTPEQAAAIAQILVDNQVAELAGRARQGRAGLEAAGEGLLALLEAGKRPSKALQPAATFWVTLARYGQEFHKPEVMRRALAGLAEDLPGEAQLKPLVASLTQGAERLERHADLKARVDAGEKGLEADLLLAEHAIGLVDGAAFKERAQALLETATVAQCAALHLALREVAFKEVLDTAFEGRQLKEDSVKALLALIEEGGDPPPAIAGRTWSVLAAWAGQALDPDLMERCARGLRQAFPDNAAVRTRAERLEQDARKLRAERAEDGG